MVIEKQARERGINIVVHKYNVIHEDLIGSPVHVKRVVMNNFNKRDQIITKIMERSA